MKILNRKSVEIFLVGGLGNQLFGWAAGLALAKKLETELIVNTSQLTQRELAIPAQLLQGVKISGRSLLYNRSNSKWLKRAYRNFPFNRSYFEREYCFESRFAEISRPVRLHGFFQSTNYFSEINSEILKLLNTEKNLTEQYREVRRGLPDRFISIHFRRGDYVENSNFHPLATNEYYENAFNYLGAKGITHKKVIFTDDLTLAREVFPKDLIVAQNNLAEPFDNLHLMSRGEAIIGANSSFSLWAALICSASGGVCIFPKKWFGEGNLRGLSPVPTHFIRL